MSTIPLHPELNQINFFLSLTSSIYFVGIFLKELYRGFVDFLRTKQCISPVMIGARASPSPIVRLHNAISSTCQKAQRISDRLSPFLQAKPFLALA